MAHKRTIETSLTVDENAERAITEVLENLMAEREQSFEQVSKNWTASERMAGQLRLQQEKAYLEARLDSEVQTTKARKKNIKDFVENQSVAIAEVARKDSALLEVMVEGAQDVADEAQAPVKPQRFEKFKSAVGSGARSVSGFFNKQLKSLGGAATRLVLPMATLGFWLKAYGDSIDNQRSNFMTLARQGQSATENNADALQMTMLDMDKAFMGLNQNFSQYSRELRGSFSKFAEVLPNKGVDELTVIMEQAASGAFSWGISLNEMTTMTTDLILGMGMRADEALTYLESVKQYSTKVARQYGGAGIDMMKLRKTMVELTLATKNHGISQAQAGEATALFAREISSGKMSLQDLVSFLTGGPSRGKEGFLAWAADQMIGELAGKPEFAQVRQLLVAAKGSSEDKGEQALALAEALGAMTGGQTKTLQELFTRYGMGKIDKDLVSRMSQKSHEGMKKTLDRAAGGLMASEGGVQFGREEMYGWIYEGVGSLAMDQRRLFMNATLTGGKGALGPPGAPRAMPPKSFAKVYAETSKRILTMIEDNTKLANESGSIITKAWLAIGDLSALAVTATGIGIRTGLEGVEERGGFGFGPINKKVPTAPKPSAPRVKNPASTPPGPIASGTQESDVYGPQIPVNMLITVEGDGAGGSSPNKTPDLFGPAEGNQ